jgi:hypothetical protein
MGASEWRYFVPYNQPRRAFDQLRRDVFARGEYHVGLRFWARFARSMDTLLARCGAVGTHSILDITRVSADPIPAIATRPSTQLGPDEWAERFSVAQSLHGTVGPLADDEYQRCFGTRKPTREAVESGIHGLQPATWTGVYIQLFGRDGEVEELCFCGTSGD